jgi:hypothetical protein
MYYSKNHEKALDQLAVYFNLMNKNNVNLMKYAMKARKHAEVIGFRSFCEHFISKKKVIKSGVNLLKKGNEKLDKSIGIFNLPAINTCRNCADCKDKCYAAGPQKRYGNCRQSRWANLVIALTFPANFVKEITRQIDSQNIKKVRIHESGDFYNSAYCFLWEQIAQNCESTRFYFYTKTNISTDWLNGLDNVNRVESILPDGSINFGSLEYCEVKAAEFKIDICPVTAGNEAIKCGKTCDMCLKKRYMLFVQHSG